MHNLQATPTRPTSNPIFIPADLTTCSHVFLRSDSVRKPLPPIYDGPFRVLQKGKRALTIPQNGRKSVVSIDCVKSAHLDKPVTENSASVFHPNTRIREQENQ
ncbi:unnamed protein product [Hymenolepis diminuta]|uniref:Uncharacterized protein n=1 Tax=Hymenolepis diminuta TaxID=6216 RepID=A0A564Y8X1_HYMDI|nr:unnamed protein product [Hymenolepis diminuta]